MAKKPCNFPVSLDNLNVDRQSGDVVTSDSYDVIENAINALEQKVGIDGSTVTTSHDYKITDLVSKKHTQGTDTTLGTMTADINMNSHQLTSLSAPDASGEAIRQTSKITEAMLEKTLYITENAQTGTTYTLVIGDDHKLVSCSNSSAITLTIPTNESVAFPVGTQILILQKGTGQVTISKATGVTVNSVDGANKTVAQYSMAGLIKLATDTWILFGDLEA